MFKSEFNNINIAANIDIKNSSLLYIGSFIGRKENDLFMKDIYFTGNITATNNNNIYFGRYIGYVASSNYKLYARYFTGDIILLENEKTTFGNIIGFSKYNIIFGTLKELHYKD